MKEINDTSRKALIYLNKSDKEICISVLAKQIEVTYGHLRSLLQILKENGLVECYKLDKDARKTITVLKPKGKELAELFYKIEEIIG